MSVALPSKIFCQQTHQKNWWRENIVPVPGLIGMFDADRALPWDPFVVVYANDWPNSLTVIFPRMRLKRRVGLPYDPKKDDGEEKYTYEFGVDRMTEKYETSKICTCEFRQGDDFVCHCGAQQSDYQSTFVRTAYPNRHILDGEEKVPLYKTHMLVPHAGTRGASTTPYALPWAWPYIWVEFPPSLEDVQMLPLSHNYPVT